MNSLSTPVLVDIGRRAMLSDGPRSGRVRQGRITVSARCDICAKEPGFGRSVARLGKNALKRRVKSRTPRMFRPNIQIAHTIVDGTPKRVRVCTSCLKKGKVERRVQR